MSRPGPRPADVHEPASADALPPASSLPGAWQPLPAPAPPSAAPAASLRPAGLERRFAAFCVDYAVLAILGTAAAKLLGPLVGSDGGPLLGTAVFDGGWRATTALVVGWLYHAGGQCSAWQATPGKRMLGLRVVSTRGKRLGFGRATARFVASLVSTAFCWMGYFVAGFNRENAAFHDEIARTRVVRP